jgi:hypothetical protein
MSALLSFLGGSVFRMLWGEVSAYFTRKQEHEQELARITAQEVIDAAQHTRNLESINLQATLGVKTIQVQADADMARIDAAAWADAVRDVGKQTGIKFIDIWNGIIRPSLATLACAFLIAEAVHNGMNPTPHIIMVCDAILGIYIAERSLGKRGK